MTWSQVANSWSRSAVSGLGRRGRCASASRGPAAADALLPLGGHLAFDPRGRGGDAGELVGRPVGAGIDGDLPQPVLRSNPSSMIRRTPTPTATLATRVAMPMVTPRVVRKVRSFCRGRESRPARRR